MNNVAAGSKGNEEEAKRPRRRPTTSVMVTEAIRTLDERDGSSLRAITKYMVDNYEVDVDKWTRLIQRYLKDSVASGILLHIKGKGSSGRFKLAYSSSKKNKTPPKSKGGKEIKKKETVTSCEWISKSRSEEMSVMATACDWCLQRRAHLFVIEERLWRFWKVISEEGPTSESQRNICERCRSRYVAFADYIGRCKSSEAVVEMARAAARDPLS